MLFKNLAGKRFSVIDGQNGCLAIVGKKKEVVAFCGHCNDGPYGSRDKIETLGYLCVQAEDA